MYWLYKDSKFENGYISYSFLNFVVKYNICTSIERHTIKTPFCRHIYAYYIIIITTCITLCRVGIHIALCRFGICDVLCRIRIYLVYMQNEILVIETCHLMIWN
jgi:hypothetical protein